MQKYWNRGLPLVASGLSGLLPPCFCASSVVVSVFWDFGSLYTSRRCGVILASCCGSGNTRRRFGVPVASRLRPAEIRSFQAVHLTCMIVTVPGNRPHGCVRRRLLGLLLVGHTTTYSVVGPSEMGQAPPCLVGSAPRRTCGLVESFQFAIVYFDTTCGPSISLKVLKAFSPLECRVLWIGYLLPFFFTERFDVGQDVFPEPVAVGLKL